MAQPTLYVDFHNADPQARLRRNCLGTVRDLADTQIALSAGLRLTVPDGELIADGEVHFAEEERLSVVLIDGDRLRPRDDDPAVGADAATLRSRTRPIAP